MAWSCSRRVVRRATAACAAALLPAVLVSVVAPPARAADPIQLISSDAETAPVAHSGDAMDDPAIWVHPTDPSRSLVMGNDKGGGFETYDLDGSLVQRLTFGNQFWGNVDVRQGVRVNGITHDLVGVVQRGVRFYSPDPDTRLLSQVTEGDAPIGANGEGFCLYESPSSHKVYGISITIQGTLNQFELTDDDADGLLESTTVRTFSVGSEAEGCVADDDTGALYVSEENVALWRYDAEPTGGTTREAVDVLTSAGGHLTNDIEGVTLVDQPGGAGFVIVSDQNAVDPDASFFNVYRRGGSNAFVKSFRVSDGASSDDCDRTDGITATTADLGPSYPRGIFVCQDNNNDAPGVGHQDLKLVKLERVVNLDGGEEPPPDPEPEPSSISFVGQSTANTNATSFAAQVPAGVRAGDALLLFASQGTTTALTGPGAGWTQVGRVTDTRHATTVWRRVATASDAGTTVRVGSGSTFTKVGLTLAAYRGTDTTNPLVSVTGAAEPGSTGSHTTPTVPSSTTGAVRVSYWSDKNSATTAWTAPSGETRRASGFGSGGGRIDTLLTDLGTPLTAGAPATTGGRTAVANAAASAATSFTLLLRPASGGTTPPANEPPTAVFTSSCTGLVCTFDGSGSTDPDDGVTTWDWDFGDDTTGSESVEEHTFPSAGSYTVSLTVTDDSGESDAVEHVVAVSVPPPVSFVGQASSNVNSTAFTVQVPASVRAGDALLLFASQGSATTLTGPGTGWVQAGRVADGQVTTVWRKVATASDGGSTVRLASGSTYVKVALTLAAYRGTDTSDPVAGLAGAPEAGTATSHTTPSVANGTDGAWRVSYWSDKNSGTTTWTTPSGETRRVSSFGTGGGRISALLTDSGAALSAGSPATTGGRLATADAASSTATTWTVLLRPVG